jgi:hypothetical protein
VNRRTRSGLQARACSVSGHDFSHAEKGNKMNWAIQATEKRKIELALYQGAALAAPK